MRPLGSPLSRAAWIATSDATDWAMASDRCSYSTALRDRDMAIQPGECCAVVGPTGCGKSTTLALISGLEPASEGEVTVFGEPVTGIAKGIGYVFQTDAVFPWKTVLGNVAAGPRYHGASNRDASERARDWIARVGLAA